MQAMKRRRNVAFGALVLVAMVAMAVTGAPTFGGAELRAQPGASAVTAVYVAYFWRAKPGKMDEYSEYIRTIAEPIDAEAKKAGAFEEVHTYLTTPQRGTAQDWTHLRVFRVKDAAAADQLGAALDDATTRHVPDDAKRKANSERSASLRDFVREERWSELR